MIHLLTSYLGLGGYIFKSKSKKNRGLGKNRRGKGRKSRKYLRNGFIPHPY